MPDWGVGWDGQILEDEGPDTSTSKGKSVATSAAANTKGSWTQLVASTAHPGTGLIVSTANESSGASTLLDIGIGAGGSEKVVIPNMYVQGGGERVAVCYIPLYVPQGVRIAARQQDTGGTETTRTSVHVLSGGWPTGVPLHRVTDYGTDTATSGVTTITSSGSTNTKGSWSQLTASCNEMRWCVVMMNPGSGSYSLLDIGVGGAGSEKVVVPNLQYKHAWTGSLFPFSFPLSVPAGSRIAARIQGATGSSTTKIALLGVG